MGGLAKADAQRTQGTTEAEIIRLKGVAEAKQKIAEAFEQFGQAVVMDMILKMLPEHAKQVAFIFGSFTVRTWLCYLRLRKRYDLICNLKFPKNSPHFKVWAVFGFLSID